MEELLKDSMADTLKSLGRSIEVLGELLNLHTKRLARTEAKLSQLMLHVGMTTDGRKALTNQEVL